VNNLPFTLAWRYLRSGRKEKNTAFMIRMCLLGIIIGSCALMLTLIITNGFERTIHEKMQGINAPITMRYIGNKVDGDKVRRAVTEKCGEAIEAVAASSTGQILIDHNDCQTPLVLKGVEAEHEEKVTTLAEKLLTTRDGKKSFTTLLNDNEIIIGHKTAHSCGITVGDTIKLLIPEPGGRTRINLSKRKVVVTGIFNVGLDEYDSGFALCSLDLFNDLFDTCGAETLAIKTRGKNSWYERLVGASQHENIIEKLKGAFPSFDVYSWKELYPALVSSLKLEKYVMFIIIALITLVASMNMISLLFIQIQQKRKDCAILMAMGMPPRDIQRIFLSIGLTITCLGSLIGLGIAAVVGFLLERYPFIQLPDVYYVSHLPARVDPELFVIVFACTMLLGFVATIIPARQTRGMKIVDVLRSE